MSSNRSSRTFFSVLILCHFLLGACHLSQENDRVENVFTFPTLPDTLSGADFATIRLLSLDRELLDTLFHGKVTADVQFNRLPAPHYSGGRALIVIEASKQGRTFYKVEMEWDGQEDKVVAMVPIIVPTSSVRIQGLPSHPIEGDSALLPSVKVLPENLADASYQWKSRAESILVVNSTHYKGVSKGKVTLVVQLKSDTTKKDSVEITVRAKSAQKVERVRFEADSIGLFHRCHAAAAPAF